MTEDELAGLHHQLNRHEFKQTLGRTEKPDGLQSIGLQSRTRLSDYTKFGY